MPIITAEDFMEDVVSVYPYGPIGSGKTYLVTTLYGPKYPDAISVITGDKRGLKSLKYRGYARPGKSWYHFRQQQGVDPFVEVRTAVDRAIRDESVKAISVDGATDLYVQFSHYHTDGAGDKAMGYEGWDKLKANFEHLELQLTEARDRGKHVVVTALEEDPEFETEGFGRNARKVLVKMGGPWVAGKGGRRWLPSRFDVVARAFVKTKKIPGAPGKLPEEVLEASLWVKPTDNLYTQRTRLSFLPNPCPSSLKFILDQVRKANEQ